MASLPSDRSAVLAAIGFVLMAIAAVAIFHGWGLLAVGTLLFVSSVVRMRQQMAKEALEDQAGLDDD